MEYSWIIYTNYDNLLTPKNFMPACQSAKTKWKPSKHSSGVYPFSMDFKALTACSMVRWYPISPCSTIVMFSPLPSFGRYCYTCWSTFTIPSLETSDSKIIPICIWNQNQTKEGRTYFYGKYKVVSFPYTAYLKYVPLVCIHLPPDLKIIPICIWNQNQTQKRKNMILWQIQCCEFSLHCLHVLAILVTQM